MAAPIPETHLDLLGRDTKAFAHLALVTSDGRPQVTPMWFDDDGEHVLFNTARGLTVGRLPDGPHRLLERSANRRDALVEQLGVDALLVGTPGLAVIVDSFEQRVQRPRDRAGADTYDSGTQE